MDIREISRTPRTADRSPVLHVEISDGRKAREYMMIASRNHLTVFAGKVTRRSLGKVFWSRAALAQHYKRDGATLLSLVNDWQDAVGTPA